jgi:hypothetical protein
MDGRLRAATALGFDIPALSRIGDELATIRGLVFADPLSLPEDARRIFGAALRAQSMASMLMAHRPTKRARAPA